MWTCSARTPGESPAEERFALFEAVSDALGAAAEPRLLAHLVRGLDGVRLAVVATYRDTETTGQDAVRAALAAPGR
ncbi:MAG TPA: hypothetical protein VI011_13640 [Asanoa sp.]